MATMLSGATSTLQLQLLRDRLGRNVDLLDFIPIQKVDLRLYQQTSDTTKTIKPAYTNNKIRGGIYEEDSVFWAVISSTLMHKALQLSFIRFDEQNGLPEPIARADVVKLGRFCRVFRPVASDYNELSAIFKACFVLKGAELPVGTGFGDEFVSTLTRACRKLQLARQCVPPRRRKGEPTTMGSKPEHVPALNMSTPASSDRSSEQTALTTTLLAQGTNNPRQTNQDEDMSDNASDSSSERISSETDFLETSARLGDIRDDLARLESDIAGVKTKFDTQRMKIKDEKTRLATQREDKINAAVEAIDKEMKEAKRVLNNKMHQLDDEQKEEIDSYNKEMKRKTEEEVLMKQEFRSKHEAATWAYRKHLLQAADRAERDKRSKRYH